ncbi:MAG: SDR family oxidoreductase [Ornithinibacter sp.]
MTIVVTGATGQLGRLVVESLLRRGASPHEVVATGRNTEHLAELAEQDGVRTAVADFGDPTTLRSAFDGADRVLLVSGTEMGQRVAQHTAVVRAAQGAGVELLAYTSIPHADTAQMALAAEHRETERVIRESGVPFTFLRNSWYLETYLPQIPTYLEHGIVGAAGDGRISAATRADFADAAAAALLDPASTGRVYELGGASFTLTELAATVAESSGRPVTYTEVPPAQLTEILVGAGVPRPYAEALVSADLGIARGELEVTSGDLERLIGHSPTSLRDAVDASLATLTA